MNFRRTNTLIQKYLQDKLILRRTILIFLDYLSINFAILISFFNQDKKTFLSIDLNNFYNISLIFIFVPLIFIITYYFTGQYKGLTKYTGSTSFYKLAIKNLLLTIILSLFLSRIPINLTYYFFWVELWIISTLFTISYRLILRDILILPRFSENSQTLKVIIYGAGQAGANLAYSLLNAGNYQIISFFDDSPKLLGRTIHGIQIKKTKIDYSLKNKIDQLLIALPSINTSKRVSILKEINKYSIPVYQIPTIKELTSGKFFINDLKPINIEDLLARDFVAPRKDLLGKGIKNQTIMVIGAAGSIGKELCKQILLLNPNELILLDNSESSLYQAINFLEKNNYSNVKVYPLIGNACNSNHLESIIEKYKVNTIFHAAAYKHVPIVEDNPLEGIYNNVFSTLTICKLVSKSKYAHKMIFISTDKAVRPTNVMGASKRLGELIVQAFANDEVNSKSRKTSHGKIFSMVRFGNVLGSSGSVVPLFKKQIELGGPITITHHEIVRYFMTIEEAAQLVLQSLGLAKGGEVFLLDMGNPVKIKDLAEQMVHLSGLTIKNKHNLEGDIEIKYTGLRSGEKLYEELLVSEDSEKTSHPLIFKAIEFPRELDKLLININDLNKFIKTNQTENALKILNKIIPEWKRSRAKWI